MVAPTPPPSPTPSRRLPHLIKATYLSDNEYLILETRKSKLLYFPGPILFLIIFGILALLVEGPYVGIHTVSWPSYLSFLTGTTGKYVGYFLVFLVVIGLLWLLVRTLKYFRYAYAVTNRRVIIQTGILGKNFDEIPLGQIRAIDVRQTLFQRMLGYGHVELTSEGGQGIGDERGDGIPKPMQFQRKIENASQALANEPKPVYQVAAPQYGAPPPQGQPPR